MEMRWIADHEPEEGMTSPPHVTRACRAAPILNADIDVTLFIACYNEEANIVATLDTVVAAVCEVGCTWEIVLIDDASTDDSVRLARDYQRRHPQLPIRLIVNPRNRGLARNFVEASFLGRGEYFKLVCGDNVESRETLVTILRHLGTVDLVVPYHIDCPGKSRGRLFLSRLYTRLVNAIGGHSLRYYNGLPLVRRQHVMRWHSHTSGFGFQAELLTRLLDEGISHIQVHAAARERAGGTSRALTARNLFCVARTLLDIGLRRLERGLFGA